MAKRGVVFGTYDTAAQGWTLSGLALSEPLIKTNFVAVPGADGDLDLSTALTAGEPYYGDREFSATLESSEGTRLEREQRINTMINKLDGWRHNIILPDDPTHYISGRVKVERLYNDTAHASVRVTATCDPWRYNNAETVVGLIATSTVQTVSLINMGRLSVVPNITVTGGSVTLLFEAGGSERTWALTPGEYILADIFLKSGSAPLKYSGSGQITLTYREAVL